MARITYMNTHTYTFHTTLLLGTLIYQIKHRSQ